MDNPLLKDLVEYLMSDIKIAALDIADMLRKKYKTDN